jgi:hypothetical protein
MLPNHYLVPKYKNMDDDLNYRSCDSNEANDKTTFNTWKQKINVQLIYNLLYREKCTYIEEE